MDLEKIAMRGGDLAAGWLPPFERVNPAVVDNFETTSWAAVAVVLKFWGRRRSRVWYSIIYV